MACPISAKLFIQDRNNQEWVQYNTATPIAYHSAVYFPSPTTFKDVNTVGDNKDSGYFEFRIDFGDKATYKTLWGASENLYKFRVELTDNAAIDPVAITIFDEFEVLAYDKCWRNTLTLTTDQSDKLYTMEQDGSTAA